MTGRFTTINMDSKEKIGKVQGTRYHFFLETPTKNGTKNPRNTCRTSSRSMQTTAGKSIFLYSSGASLPLKPYLPISPALPKWSSKSHTWGFFKLNFSITQDLNELVYSHSGTIVHVNHCKSMVHTMLTSVYRMKMMAHSTCMVEQILWLPLAKVVISSDEYGSSVCLISLVFRSISSVFKNPARSRCRERIVLGPSTIPTCALLAGMPAFFPVSLFNLQGSMRKHTGKNVCPLKD